MRAGGQSEKDPLYAHWLPMLEQVEALAAEMKWEGKPEHAARAEREV